MDEVWVCQSQTILSVRCELEAHQFSSLSNYAAIASALSSSRSLPLVSSLASIHRLTGMALQPLLIISESEAVFSVSRTDERLGGQQSVRTIRCRWQPLLSKLQLII